MARILVIDDDEQILRTLHQVLEMEGHEAFDAPNGKEGMRVPVVDSRVFIKSISPHFFRSIMDVLDWS